MMGGGGGRLPDQIPSHHYAKHISPCVAFLTGRHTAEKITNGRKRGSLRQPTWRFRAECRLTTYQFQSSLIFHASVPFFVQLSGGHKYVPARQDVNAPDLYIPIMGLWTYCILVGFALFGGQAFRPELVYNTVSAAIGAWTVHTFLLKLLLWVLGISSVVPLLELAAYAGYPFVAACVVLGAKLALGALQHSSS